MLSRVILSQIRRDRVTGRQAPLDPGRRGSVNKGRVDPREAHRTVSRVKGRPAHGRVFHLLPGRPGEITKGSSSVSPSKYATVSVGVCHGAPMITATRPSTSR